jgi:histidinol phosphatase-like PHP family hydrolase
LLDDINEAKTNFRNLTLLSGCEAKVLNLEGDLDVPDHVVDSCDVVTGVFHGFKYTDKSSYLNALLSMLKNPIVNIWGHPTLFAQKNGLSLNLDEIETIVSTCVDNDVLIEINTKYSLPSEDFLKTALNFNAKFVIGSDSHSIDDLLNLDRIKVIHNWVNKMY